MLTTRDREFESSNNAFDVWGVRQQNVAIHVSMPDITVNLQNAYYNAVHLQHLKKQRGPTDSHFVIFLVVLNFLLNGQIFQYFLDRLFYVH